MSQFPGRVEVARLGPAEYPSPKAHAPLTSEGVSPFTPDDCYVRRNVELLASAPADDGQLFPKAGARSRIFFDPAQTKAAIVTCGGLCPGLNNVIRSAFLELRMNYGVPEVLGIREGYRGLNPAEGQPPLPLTLDLVEDIHEEGGTMLGSSRGPQDPVVMADFLVANGINILLCVGGDGTQRGAHSLAVEIARRSLKISVIGIPKTIDNDIEYCDRSFGFVTAVAEAQRVLSCAHVEAKGAPMGIGLVRVMGREAGFVAAAATLASQEVNFCLIPESPFALHGECGLLSALRRRMLARRHAVILVAEGAGQELFEVAAGCTDASGNRKLQDIGPFLHQAIIDYFDEHGPKVNVKYIDPSYIVRSVPAHCEDDILCDQYARRAVHAAMAGFTDAMVGLMNGSFALVPLEMATRKKRHVAIDGELWNSVLSATGQPRLLR
ncbi:MAG: ATP-dependent 6-phosphofructokinase [Planctomycetota bacterium]